MDEVQDKCHYSSMKSGWEKEDREISWGEKCTKGVKVGFQVEYVCKWANQKGGK